MQGKFIQKDSWYAGLSYKWKIRNSSSWENVKINSPYYQDNILTPIYHKETPALYGTTKNKVWIHKDKATSHTSKSTLKFMDKMEHETGIQAIPFTDIPVKSPDTAPIDFCYFGLLK
ncbi:hypothetical protein C0J52_02035 [Blattella germanica]|nr:hypothetical protein C0J52_02035 [Blattella germanica]